MISLSVNSIRLMMVSLIILSAPLPSMVYASEYDAVITLPRAYKLSLPVSGVIESVKVVAGQTVKTGESLILLHRTPFNAERSRAESEVSLLRVSLKESQRDLRLQQQLYDQAALATVALENAQFRVTRDQAKLKGAQATLDDANYKHQHSTLTAPFNAKILSVHVNEGQSISNSLHSETLVQLVQLGVYQAKLIVPADIASNLKPHQEAGVLIQNTKMAGHIKSISQETTDVNTGDGYTVIIHFESNDEVLTSGTKARITLNQ